MKAEGKQAFGWRRRQITFGIVVFAALLATVALVFGHRHPSTDDASIDADIVHVAPAVGGRIIEIGVAENARVKKGQLLFQIDPLPYRLVVAQTSADLRIAEAQLDTQRRILSTQRSAAIIAAEQTKSAQSNSALALRTAERLRPLTANGFVPKQQLDQAEVMARDASTTLRQALEQQAAALHAIDTEQAAEATVRAREAALALAKRQLADTTVRAHHNGLVVGLKVSSGEFVVPSQALFTLINTEEWFAVANFRETDLHAIAPGDCATVFSMIDRGHSIKGVVQGIGWGVLDHERVDLPRSLPYVERSMNWVRVAQRFPVRITLDHPPPDSMRLGASAVVEVRYGDQCD